MAELAPNDWATAEEVWVLLTAAVPLPDEPPLAFALSCPSCLLLLLSSAYWSSRSFVECCSVTVANEPGVAAVAWVLYDEPLADMERDRRMAPGMGTGVVAGDAPALGVEDRIKLWVPSAIAPLLASSILCRMACCALDKTDSRY